MIKISNNVLDVSIDPIGAQLVQIFHKETKLDYLWDGNPRVWGKHAPNLFPAIGETFNGKYYYDGVMYSMPRHGFIQNKHFGVGQYSNSAIFTLMYSEETLQYFPFKWKLQIKFELVDNKIRQSFVVYNLDNKTISFSVGGHPAFSTSLKDATFEDFFLHFAGDYQLNCGGEISELEIFELKPPFRSGKTAKISEYDGVLALRRSLFDNDSLIINSRATVDMRQKLKYTKVSKSTVDKPVDYVNKIEQHIQSVMLLNHKNSHGVRLNFSDFPVLCIWTKQQEDAQYICLEPFYGFADLLGNSVELMHKDGNAHLQPGCVRTFNYDMIFF